MDYLRWLYIRLFKPDVWYQPRAETELREAIEVALQKSVSTVFRR